MGLRTHHIIGDSPYTSCAPCVVYPIVQRRQCQVSGCTAPYAAHAMSALGLSCTSTVFRNPSSLASFFGAEEKIACTATPSPTTAITATHHRHHCLYMMIPEMMHINQHPHEQFSRPRPRATKSHAGPPRRVNISTCSPWQHGTARWVRQRGANSCLLYSVAERCRGRVLDSVQGPWLGCRSTLGASSGSIKSWV